jgi:alginate O-acetyltransferase complex protein AlgI
VFYGFLHGCYFIPYILGGTLNKKKKMVKGKLLPSFRTFINILGTFTLVTLTFIIFRSETIAQAFDFYSRLFSSSLFSIPVIPSGWRITAVTLVFICLMFAIEWTGRDQEYGIADLRAKWPVPVRWGFYYGIILLIVVFGGSQQDFIYSKF